MISNRISFALAATGLVAIGGAVGWTLHGGGSRAQTEGVVHDYILSHPEILPQAMDNLRAQESAQALGGIRGAVEKPWPGAVLGNPNGKLTLVEFTDYACGYCRASLSDIDAAIAANPDLKVVVRELPILTPASVDAAKMALAAAAQGRYAAFRKAMFAAGHPDAASIVAAASAAGVDAGRAQTTIADPATRAEIVDNVGLARQLGFTGTPGWVIGNQVLTGAVGRDALAQAITAARGKS